MQTFEKIYTENYEGVLRHINMRVQDMSVAEELTNDVFMKVHKHLGDYDETKSAIPTWVRFIANNIVIDHFRSSFRSLKPKYRRVAVLYFMNQKQYKEIAEILDIPMGTVFGMISRCRAMLQESLVAIR